MTTVAAPGLTAAEYLVFERASQTKHEWIDGEIREMSGASRAHNLIVRRIGTLLDVALMERPFEVYQAEMRVRIPDGPYYYPDVAVAPKPPALEDEEADTLLNPLVVVECLSPSTRHLDRGEKLDNYRRIPSLTDYLVVAQDRLWIDRYYRHGGGWRLQTLTEATATVRLPGLDCELTLAAVYAEAPGLA